MIDSVDSSPISYKSSNSNSEAQRSSTPPIQRCMDKGRLSPLQNNNKPMRRQVVLPTVKRDYEKNGLPKDDIPFDSHLRCHMIGPHTPDDTAQSCSKSPHGGAVESRKDASSELENLMETLKVTEESECLKETQDGNAAQDTSTNDIASSACSGHGYYPSRTPSLEPSQESLPSASTSYGSVPSLVPSESSGGGEGDRSSSTSSDEEEEEKAPFELMGEFLEAVMDEEFEVADKLCKMILLYEPENAECKQFQPLIEEMLKREREAELLGSEDDSGSNSKESEDDSDEDDDDNDASDEESSDQSQKESSSSSSSSEEEDVEDQR